MRPKLSGTLLEAGVDYITITCAQQLNIDRARRLSLLLAEWELAGNMIGKPFRGNGYEGFCVGSLQYGERDDGSLLRMGGQLASKFWERAYDIADNVTRLDLQATFRVTESPSLVIDRHYKELQRRKRKLKRGPEVTRIQKVTGGYTVYSGVRQSDRFGRAYNKEAQSKLDYYKGCVRYEQQFGGRRALKVSAGIRSTRLSIDSYAAEVLRFFQSRGCVVQPLLEHIKRPATAVDTTLPKRITDISRKLLWISKAVRPTLKLLIARGELELLEQALQMSLVQVSEPEIAGPI